MHFPTFFLFTAVDLSLGKTDISSFTDEQRISIISADAIDNLYAFPADMPVSEWKTILCDESGNVRKVIWAKYDDGEFYGFSQFRFAFLPENIIELFLFAQDIKGTLETADLPQGIHMLDIAENRFYGTFDAANLPPAMRILEAGENSFSGRIALEAMPPTIRHIDFSNNEISGEIQLTDLLSNLMYLYLNGNGIVQDRLVIDALSERVKEIDLRGNAFHEVVWVDGNADNRVRM